MSFDIALSGIQAINEALDQTSQNIANAGTYGYKSSRSNFSALVAGDQPTGTMIGSTTQNIGLQGGILNTGRSKDASINGRGFFIAKDPTSGVTEYTRVGIFDASKDGFLVDASGRKVQGYAITPGTTTQGALGDLAIPTGSIPAVASSKLGFVANLSSDWQTSTVPWGSPQAVDPADPPDAQSFKMAKSSTVYDTLGGQHTLTQYFTRTDDGSVGGAPGSVDIHYVLDGTDLATPTTMTFDTTTGQMTFPDSTTAGTVTLDLSTLAPAQPNGATFKPMVIDYTGSTGFAGEATVSVNNTDGYASGTYSDFAVSSDGSVIASYSNGQKQTVGKLAIATFPDEGALTAVDNTSWIESVSSGTPLVNAPGVGMGGTLNTSSLEQSNVDITSELVGLMTSQRNYQANSKVIQTESTMLQSLMQAI